MQYLRPTYIEINLSKLKNNIAIIKNYIGNEKKIVSVVKDNAYGHGIVEISKALEEAGTDFFAVATIEEAQVLKESRIKKDIIIFGERPVNQLELCIKNDFIIFVNDIRTAEIYNKLAEKYNKIGRVHIEIDTGLSRYGIRWDEASNIILEISNFKNIKIEGIMSHFAMSDELDKTFAKLQLYRFKEVLSCLQGIDIKYKHMCNTGGVLDIPEAHFNMVRTGILPLGVYPSKVCNRLDGIEPIMEIKSKLAVVKKIKKGDYVGYGMHYIAEKDHLIGVVPIGYGDGFPRVRNNGYFLINGKKAKIIGGNAMDATMVNLDGIGNVKQWDDVIILGNMGDNKITIHDLAELKGTVSYDIFANLNHRIPRYYIK